MWSEFWWRPNQAHNGYIELYLNSGLIGLFLLGTVIISTYRKGRKELLLNLPYANFRIGFLVIVLFYGITESTFRGLHPVWFIFLLIAIDVPSLRALEMIKHSLLNYMKDVRMSRS
jgi:O-antigen ligase